MAEWQLHSMVPGTEPSLDLPSAQVQTESPGLAHVTALSTTNYQLGDVYNNYVLGGLIQFILCLCRQIP